MTARPISLIRQPVPPADLSLFQPVARQLTKDLGAVLARETRGLLSLATGATSLVHYPEWRISQNPHGVLFRYCDPANSNEAIIHVPGHLVNEIVDIRYGGTGKAASAGAFSATEIRFLDRLGARLGEPLTPILHSTEAGMATFAGLSTDLLAPVWTKARDQIVMQSFVVENSIAKAAVISLMLVPESLHGIGRYEDEGSSASAQPRSTAKIEDAALHVRLPVRTVLATSQVPMTKVIALAAGDILTMPISTQASLIIGDRTFASGSIGEANGHAALLVEKLHKGPIHE